jgi:hypothetical protein
MYVVLYVNDCDLYPQTRNVQENPSDHKTVGTSIYDMPTLPDFDARWVAGYDFSVVPMGSDVTDTIIYGLSLVTQYCACFMGGKGLVYPRSLGSHHYLCATAQSSLLRVVPKDGGSGKACEGASTCIRGTGALEKQKMRRFPSELDFRCGFAHAGQTGAAGFAATGAVGGFT